MSTISNFLLANLAERLTPLLQTPVEDIVYEILDRKGLPTRSEIRDLKNRLERIDEEVKELTEQLARVRETAAAAKPAPAPAPTKAARVAKPKAKPQPEKPKAAEVAPAEAPQPKRRGRPPRQGPPPECTAGDCKLPVRSKGLCARHYQSWRRGRLPGFVSPDGFVLVDGKNVKLDKRYAGAPVTAQVEGAMVVFGIKGKELKRKLPADPPKKKAAKKKVAPAKAAKKPAAKKSVARKPAAKKPVAKKPAAKKPAAKKPAAKKPAAKKGAAKKG